MSRTPGPRVPPSLAERLTRRTVRSFNAALQAHPDFAEAFLPRTVGDMASSYAYGSWEASVGGGAEKKGLPSRNGP